MAEDVILSVKNISKSFGDLQVLRKISFDIHKGEKIAILGPSGSGKSTILRCINQLETYDSGEINYMGKPVNSGQALHELRQHIGMVFQRFNVFTHMSVLQNVIEAPVHVKKVPKQEAIVKAKDLLKMVGLEGREEAMAMNPEVILFDEPTSALDPELVGEVLSVIRKVAAEGVSMVIVTHEMNFAREVADRILFMEDGVIVEDAPPEEFFEHPKNDRIRQFIRKVEER